MRKLTPGILPAILLLVAITLLWGLRSNREALSRAKAEARQLEHQRDSLLEAVQGRDSSAAVLVLERGRLDSLATRLRDSVDTLEARRAAAQLTVRQIRTVGKLQARLRQSFPQLGRNGWGLITLPVYQPQVPPLPDGRGGQGVRNHQRDTIGIQYLLVPAWFAETFVIDRANAESWRAQKDQLVAVDSLRVIVAALQDSLTILATANANAYRAGYQAAYAGYQDLSKRYAAELSKPRIRVGSALGLLTATGIGVVIGRSSRE